MAGRETAPALFVSGGSGEIGRALPVISLALVREVKADVGAAASCAVVLERGGAAAGGTKRASNALRRSGHSLLTLLSRSLHQRNASSPRQVETYRAS